MIKVSFCWIFFSVMMKWFVTIECGWSRFDRLVILSCWIMRQTNLFDQLFSKRVRCFFSPCQDIDDVMYDVPPLIRSARPLSVLTDGLVVVINVVFTWHHPFSTSSESSNCRLGIRRDCWHFNSLTRKSLCREIDTLCHTSLVWEISSTFVWCDSFSFRLEDYLENGSLAWEMRPIVKDILSQQHRHFVIAKDRSSARKRNSLSFFGTSPFSHESLTGVTRYIRRKSVLTSDQKILLIIDVLADSNH